jgi:3-hydroxyisobutyrate dehydrogenase
MARIGFIGLGNMGLPMAANLVKAGHAVTGFDVVASSLSKFASTGGSAAQSNASAIAGAEVIVTMLPAGKEVREVYLSGDGVLARAAPGALLIDSSTIDVETARAVARAAEAKSFAMLDAPVSGGVTGAQAATLTFMVGGPAGAFARAKPLLDAMGKTIVHAGAAGSGQAAKICNNMMLAISMIGVSEGFLLADKLGLDRQRLFDIASKSSGQSWAMTTYCPVPGLVPTSPANRDYQAGFTAAMMLKDLRLSQEAARVAGATTPLGAEAAALFGLYVAHGQGALDFSGIINFLRGK